MDELTSVLLLEPAWARRCLQEKPSVACMSSLPQNSTQTPLGWGAAVGPTPTLHSASVAWQLLAAVLVLAVLCGLLVSWKIQNALALAEPGAVPTANSGARPKPPASGGAAPELCSNTSPPEPETPTTLREGTGAGRGARDAAALAVASEVVGGPGVAACTVLARSEPSAAIAVQGAAATTDARRSIEVSLREGSLGLRGAEGDPREVSAELPDGEQHHSWPDGSEYFGEWRGNKVGT